MSSARGRAILAGALLASTAAALLACATPVLAAARQPLPTAVLGRDARALAPRIVLDDDITRAPLDRARLVWIVGPVDAATRQRVIARVRRGDAGLVIALGEAGAGDARALISALDLTPPARAHQQRATITARSDDALPRALREQVVWSTAPQIGRRLVLTHPPASYRVVATAAKAPLLLLGRLGRGRVALLAVDLAHRSNRDLVLWPYFNYLLYALSSNAANRTPASFARWKHSPVPSVSALWIIAPILLVAWLVTLGLFFKARRYSRAHPEVLDTFFSGVAKAPAPRADSGGGGGGANVGWRSVGFARPLAGFLSLAALLFVLFAPFYWLTNIFIPNDVQPFPQAKGIWDFAWEALQVAWFLFDAGTFVAFVKYFAEYRVKDPREAVRSAQFFMWWQILTGLVQVTFACVAAIVILPHTRYGYTSGFVILVALGQYPGFFGVVTFFFQAYQRFDYNLGLDLLSDWILRFVLQIPFVLLFRAWGVAHPQYGEALGAAVGIGVGYHVSAVITFGIGVLLYRRLGLRLSPLFMAHFDRATVKRMLGYGLKVVTGKFFFRAAQTIDKVVISLLLTNYTEWLGLKSQININLMFLFPVAYRFFETAMAALSEAYGNGKRVLTQYYVVRFLQVGALYSVIGLSLMAALGPLFVREAMDPQWARAANYLIIATAIGALMAPAWLSDMLQKGAGRPELFAGVLGAEQVLRIGLFFVLIPSLQFTGFYLALLATLAIKVTGGWAINHFVIVRLRFYKWPMLVAPALTGALNYGLLRGAAAVVPLSGRWPVVIFFFAAALVSFIVCFFAYGLCGGFDKAFAGELDAASRMTGPLRPLTRLFYGAARLGWRISPLHDRYPVTIEPDAMREAAELQALVAARDAPQDAPAEGS